MKTGSRLKAQPFEVAQRVDKLLAEERELQREIDKLKQRIASGGGGRDLMAEAVTIKGIRVLAAQVDVDDAKVLRDTGDQLADGGRLVAVVRERGVGRAMLFARNAEIISTRVLFDASVSMLPGLQRQPGFVF